MGEGLVGTMAMYAHPLDRPCRGFGFLMPLQLERAFNGSRGIAWRSGLPQRLAHFDAIRVERHPLMPATAFACRARREDGSSRTASGLPAAALS